MFQKDESKERLVTMTIRQEVGVRMSSGNERDNQVNNTEGKVMGSMGKARRRS